MEEFTPLTPQELRNLPPLLDLYRSIYTGELFELHRIDNDDTAHLIFVSEMTDATMPYDKFRQMTVPEPKFIGEDR